MVQYGYILRLYALLYVIVFVGGPLRAGLQALEFTVPIFWSYLAMTALRFSFAVSDGKVAGIERLAARTHRSADSLSKHRRHCPAIESAPRRAAGSIQEVISSRDKLSRRYLLE